MSVSGVVLGPGGFPLTDERGHLIPTPKARAALDRERAGIGSIAAAAEQRLTAQFETGLPYTISDVDQVLAARDVPIARRILVKRTIEKSGVSLDQALGQLGIAPMPSLAKLEASASKRSAALGKITAAARTTTSPETFGLATKVATALNGIGGLTQAQREQIFSALTK